MPNEFEMSEQERAELEALPRHRMPSRLLEERTVNALRARGLIATARFQRGWIVAGLAAALTLFVSGFAAGQFTTQRGMNETLLTAQKMNTLEAAYLVQQTGSAYLQALNALGRVSDSTSRQAFDQGREAGISVLASAANELVRLSPEDRLSLRLRNILYTTDTSRTRSALVWF